MKTQCEAITIPSTYSVPHRCLKPADGKKGRGARLCVHHRAKEVRSRA